MYRSSHFRSVMALLALALAATLAFASSPASKRCITVLYPSGPDAKFDFAYYQSHHIPLIMRLYGKGVAKMELRRTVANKDGSPVAYIAVINIWVGSDKLFDDAGAKHAQELIDDVPNFTNMRPVILNGEIVN
ncbi:MAG TPA: EthD family reductase [Steroidobacteraceae bacterium]|nr:EthD family reductase [Steroidobacteraceae bacterium]